MKAWKTSMRLLGTLRRRLRWNLLSLISSLLLASLSPPAIAEQPNVLFISVDDLNDWVGCLKGHPQAQTPNIDRLAQSGMLFANAHCGSPACNGSRSAIMSGQPPYVSGMYDNLQEMRSVMPDAELIPKYFSRHGYWSAGSGKILHYIIDAPSWDESTSIPASNSDGNQFNVTFSNQSGQPVKVFRIDRDAPLQPFGVLEAGWSKPQLSQPGTVWLFTDKNDHPLGHFVVGDRTAQAIIPEP